MKKQLIRNKLKDILMNTFFVSQEMCSSGTIQMDSIQYIDLIVEIEDTFNIEVPDEYLTPSNSWQLDILVEAIVVALKQDD